MALHLSQPRQPLSDGSSCFQKGNLNDYILTHGFMVSQQISVSIQGDSSFLQDMSSVRYCEREIKIVFPNANCHDLKYRRRFCGPVAQVQCPGVHVYGLAFGVNFESYFSEANRNLLFVHQIETARAMKNLKVAGGIKLELDIPAVD